MQRWVLSSHTVSKCISSLEKSCLITKNVSTPKDLQVSRHQFNDSSAKSAYEILKNWGNPFQKRDSLINICSGAQADDVVKYDLLNAFDIGALAFENFLKDRIQSSTIPFYDPIKKTGLKSFKDLKVKKSVLVKEKTITIAAERSIFGRLLAISKNRPGLSLQQVLCYSLSPIPWSIGLPDGNLVKTVKSKLLSKIFYINIYLTELFGFFLLSFFHS